MGSLSFILADEEEDLRDLVKNSIDDVGAITALGELPDSVGEFIIEFLEEFEPPKVEELYDQDGKLIGIKEHDLVVFDADGNPVGKQLGDLYAVNPDGTIDEDGKLPSVFFVEDPFADVGLAAASFIDLLPTGKVKQDEQGKTGDWVPHLVAFDEDGDIVHTIFEFDEKGDLVGTKAFEKGFVEGNGNPLEIPNVQFLAVDENGGLIGQEEIGLVVADEQGKLHEFIIPDPVAYDKEGNAVGLQLPPVILLDENGRPEGLEVAEVVAKEFFQALEVLKSDHDARDVKDFLFNDDEILFDVEGLAQTIDQFRPSEIIRNEAGDIVGHKLATDLTCITRECFQSFSDDEEALAKLKEAVRVLVEDENGDFTIAELKGTDLRDENGDFAGFIEAETVLIDPNSGHAKGFLEGASKILEEFRLRAAEAELEFFDAAGKLLGTFDILPEDEKGSGHFAFDEERLNDFLPKALAFLTENTDESRTPDFQGFSVTELEEFHIGEAFAGNIELGPAELKQLFEERRGHAEPDEDFVKQIAEELGLSPDGSEEDRALLKEIIDDLKDDRRPSDERGDRDESDGQKPDLDSIRDIIDDLGLDPNGSDEDKATLREIIEDLKDGERPTDDHDGTRSGLELPDGTDQPPDDEHKPLPDDNS